MGSKPSSIRRTDSASAAYGRLRIDSPQILTPGSVRLSLQRRRQLRLLEQQDISGLIATESSPLVNIRAGAQSPMSLDIATEIQSPPLQVWIGPALCCAMAYALYNIFIKKGSSHINPVLGGVILQIVAAILGVCLMTFLMIKEGGSEVIVFDSEGIQWAVLAGLSVGVAEIVSFFVSSLGVQAMQSIPIIIGGSVLFGTVIGAVALGEDLSMRGWFGVILISVGISLVGMDSEGGGH
mmetsp:Transcript_10060/g.14944  ORF Transcript_10060/g.14944 Transcript_10060/m.14944 type:complete len:238 (-) Transcript_10060:421-1134(-)